MFVRSMKTDEWQERMDHGTLVNNPTLEQVKDAILLLDGKRKTMVVLSGKPMNDGCLIVAGQWKTRFMVNGTKNEFDFYSLVDPSRSDEKTLLYVGGQDGDYEERKCVPLSWALQAADTFCVSGTLDTALNWVSDY